MRHQYRVRACQYLEIPSISIKLPEHLESFPGCHSASLAVALDITETLAGLVLPMTLFFGRTRHSDLRSHHTVVALTSCCDLAAHNY